MSSVSPSRLSSQSQQDYILHSPTTARPTSQDWGKCSRPHDKFVGALFDFSNCPCMRLAPGNEADTWERGGHLGTRQTPGNEADTWERGGHLGTRRTPGNEADTWERGGHLGTRQTPGNEADTWERGRHLGTRPCTMLILQPPSQAT